MFHSSAILIILLSLVLLFKMANRAGNEFPERMAVHFGAGLAWFYPRLQGENRDLSNHDPWEVPQKSAMATRRFHDLVLHFGWPAPIRLLPAVTVALLMAACGVPAVAGAIIDTRGRLEIRSDDGDFRWRMDGRVHADAGWFQDHNGVEFGSGSHLRRARLGMNGQLWRRWHFKFQYDFTGSGRAGVQDAFMRYEGADGAAVTVGHFKEPLSLEVLTGANNVSFIERSLPSVLAPSRNLGLTASLRPAEQILGVIGVFGEGIDKLSDAEADTRGLDEGWAATGRVVVTPMHRDGRLLHLGAAVSRRRANDQGGTHMGTPLRVRQRPEASMTDIRMLDTGAMADADVVVTRNLEAVWVRGPFSLQGEYLAMTVGRRTPGSVDPVLRGFYVQGSWLLSGESRRYDAASGTLANPRVRRVAGLGGHGAWELLARVSKLDLNDRPDRPGGVLGGEQTNMAAGLTWYPNDNLRFMLNYVKVLVMKRPGHDLDGTRPGIALLRAQVIW